MSEALTFDYTPREQFAAFHQRDTRWACIVAHRRAGKTVACVHELVLRALYTRKKHARYGYIAPYYGQAKTIAWTYLKEACRPFLHSHKQVKESELSVTLPHGAVIRLFGADNPDSLRGTYFMGVVLDEYGDCRPALWNEVILPTLADHKGWAVFIGTPKGKNHFYQIWQDSRDSEDWYHLTLKASESNIIDPDELSALQRQMQEDQYAQEFECDFTAAVGGTYYAKMISDLESKNQIQYGHPAHDPDFPVQVAADLGRKDSTALWFWQTMPDGIALIDYEEHEGQSIDFYVDLLESKPYTIEKLWLPWDAKAKTLATRRSTIEQFAYSGLPVDILPKLDRQQGIDAARKILPKCWFNLDTTFAGIEALRAYQRRWNDVLKTYSDQPMHNWASDGADAFRYLALVAQTELRRKAPPKTATQIFEDGWRPPGYTLDMLHADRESSAGRFQYEKLRI